MKKLFLILFISSAFLSNAQNARFGFSAGAAFASYRIKADGLSVGADTKVGITGGILVDVPISKNFSFQPGFNFVQKGIQYDYSEMGYVDKGKTTVNCLEIPLNFLYNYNVRSGTFFAGAGPSIAFGISGKSKYTDDTGSYEEEISFGNDPDNDDMKGLDIGINILGGFRLPGGFFGSVGFNAGLSDLVPGGSDEGTVTSNYLHVKVGFLLNGAKKK